MQRTHSLGSAVCRGPAPLAASPETFQGPGCGSRAFTALCVYGVGVSVSAAASVAVAVCLWTRTGGEAGSLPPPPGGLKCFTCL